MRCPSCTAENAATWRFCAQCGTALPVPCPACGFENETAARFCVGCGRPIGEIASPEPATPSPLPRADSAERRQLTVMFCDLVGSTALSARFDPEELREEIRAYQNAVSAVVARYDRFVAKFMGDGVLAYFGYPAAHEDDAERAVRAGLEIEAAVRSLVQQPRPWRSADVRIVALGALRHAENRRHARNPEAALGKRSGEGPQLEAVAGLVPG